MMNSRWAEEILAIVEVCLVRWVLRSDTRDLRLFMWCV